MKGKFLIGSLIILCMSITIVYAVLQTQKTINTYGNVKSLNLQVYQDSACTVVLTRIDWGLLESGQSKTVLCYLKSTSNVNATLSLSTLGWNPSNAQNYLRLTWNREGSILQSNQVLNASLTLQVDPSISGVQSFSFNIIITAMEA
jgi:hypothetical protein